MDDVSLTAKTEHPTNKHPPLTKATYQRDDCQYR